MMHQTSNHICLSHIFSYKIMFLLTVLAKLHFQIVILAKLHLGSTKIILFVGCFLGKFPIAL
jgi:hypothetical protein